MPKKNPPAPALALDLSCHPESPQGRAFSADKHLLEAALDLHRALQDSRGRGRVDLRDLLAVVRIVREQLQKLTPTLDGRKP